MHNKMQQGFTLIEVMIVIVIIGVLASLATASYGDYTMRARRVDAREALFAMAENQEKFYLINNVYTDVEADIGGADSDSGYYTLTATIANAGSTYTLAAAPAPGSVQLADTDCLAMTIDHTGLTSPADCW